MVVVHDLNLARVTINSRFVYAATKVARVNVTSIPSDFSEVAKLHARYSNFATKSRSCEPSLTITALALLISQNIRLGLTQSSQTMLVCGPYNSFI